MRSMPISTLRYWNGATGNTVPPETTPSPLCGRVLVVAALTEIARWEEVSAGLVDVAMSLQVGLPQPPFSEEPFDVIATDVSAGEGVVLGWALSLLRRRASAQIVLYCERTSAVEAVALRALGWPDLLTGPGARDWIVGVLPALIRAGQARRALRRASSDLLPRPWCDVGDSVDACTSLMVAESRFRESYVRGVLARAGGRRVEAAKRAGVPYRTFCKILQKLNVHPED